MRGLLTSLLLLPFFAAGPAFGQTADSAVRAEALLGRMTLEEKVGQLVMTGFDEAFSTDILERGGAGSVISFNDPAAIARAQEKARASRLGIPLLIGLDLLHGFRTLFPMPLAEAASFDAELAARNAELAAREAKPAGLNWTFAPVADVARDPRWGRMIETNGEDALLASDFTRARADGFRRGGLAPTLKHFAGYGAVSGGRDYDAVSVSDFELQNIHLPPFRAALGPITTVMTALTVLNGMPSSANTQLLGTTLRGKWGFDGVVVSDWKAIGGLIDQGIAQDEAEAARIALKAGVDIDMMSGIYARYLAAEAAAGRVSIQEINGAVRRVLALKFALGLFDTPPPDPSEADRAALTPELRAAARAAVRDTSVLLRNEDGVLPLRSGNIAVVGPFADNAFDQLGPHEARGMPEDAVTVLEGIREHAAKTGARVHYAQACDVACEDTSGFEAAVDASRTSDVTIVVLGEKREHSGEGASRATLGFPGKQDELLEALAATGKPIVLVVIAGRPLDLRRAAETAPAILMAWYPGTEGGHGVADLLFGDHAPSAKLPISWPRSVGQAPLSYDRLATARPYEPAARYTQRFLDEKIEPLFPFGFGLTYTNFRYSTPVVTPGTDGAAANVSVTLTNGGARAGTEIVQLYMRDDVASRVQPVKRLVRYARIALQPGESRTVEFVLRRDDLGFFDEDGHLIVEPGTFRFGAGPDSTVALDAIFTLAPP